MRNYNSYYDRPSPHSFGDTGAMYRHQRQDREDFKRAELQKELNQEYRRRKMITEQELKDKCT